MGTQRMPGTSAGGEIVYEVDSALDPGVVADFDAWLPGHAREVLASPGFLGAEILAPTEPAADGRPRRIVRYRIRDRAALETYIAERAPALRAEPLARFGERMAATRRVEAVRAGISLAACANCGAPLAGTYCASCGQHAHESARTLGTLFHDAWHSFTHLDERFWTTIRALLARPGFLTHEYFAERRARYLPPFRLYLVLSLAFFGLSSLTGGGSVNAQDAAAGSSAGALAEAAREIKAEAAREDLALPAAAGRLEAGGDAAAFDAGRCDTIALFGWLAAERALAAACRRQFADRGRSLGRAFIANVPKMMFVFVPLMAAVMLLLYWRPRRYYVEHLVYFLHVHAALFLAFVLAMLLGLVARLLPLLAPVAAAGGAALAFYAAWYVYRSMRVYYGQQRSLTLLKLGLVSIAYFVFLAITLAGTLVVSALTA